MLTALFTTTWHKCLALYFPFTIMALGFAIFPAFGQANNPERIYEKQNFQMLVLGDSVVWGQGLKTDEASGEKFWLLVKNEIENRRKELRVVVKDKSQSGARILPKQKDGAYVKVDQEAPSLTPTLWEQLDDAVEEYNCQAAPKSKNSTIDRICPDVKFVLLDGGINDIGFQNLVNPFRTSRWIRKKSKKFLREEMTTFLEAILKTFPNARVVVTGYFPIICARTREDPTGTDPDFIKNLILAYLGWNSNEKLGESGNVTQSKDQKEYVSEFSSKSNPLDWFVKQMSKHSSTWKEASDKDLKLSVEKANGNHNKRVALATVQFAKSDCYAADMNTTKLWMLTGFKENKDPITNDHRLQDRIEGNLCRDAKTKMDSIHMDPISRLILELTCKPAGTGHPNVEGAKMYAKEIIKALEAMNEIPKLNTTQ